MNPVSGALLAAADRGLIPSGETVLLAVSGGADSMALLYGAVDAADSTGWHLSVGHVHHGWRGREADRDLAFVAEHARRLRLPFFSRRRDARGAARELRLSPEAAARHVRYAALAEMADEAGASSIATAHQQEDAIESYLIARRRRAGLAGLAGPRERREDGVVRPFLSVSRGEILGFLSERAVSFRRDASNGDLRLTRNRIRRELLAGHGEADREEIIEEVRRLAEARRRLEEEFAANLAPGIQAGPAATLARAGQLQSCTPELQRLALERMATPFARSGRPPMTGREREQIRTLLAAGADFRFEAGRRIRFERRGGILSVKPSPPHFHWWAVYDSANPSSTEPEGQEIAP
jgi:tRNA(Ile)-lysidine synthetase-like protein